MQWQATSLFFWLIFLLFCGTLRAETSQVAVRGYAVLSVDGTTLDEFYPVYFDSGQRPYLQVENLLTEVLDFEKEDEIEMLSSREVYFRDHKNRYFLDYSGRQAGEENQKIKLEPSAIIVREGNTWLRYDQFQSWVPLFVAWEVENTLLRVFPKYAGR
ncbi:MAG: hypothetical protein PHQ23_01535, partial [Candidatus Wallbacteria bacterium]|nr:hypothetical protein [Candidatus Wallbacteria bacterium]